VVFGFQLLEPSGWGIVALTALAILRGLLITRRALEDERAIWRERLEQANALADRFQAAWETERAAREKERAARERMAGHSELALSAAHTATASLRALAAVAGSEDGADAPVA